MKIKSRNSLCIAVLVTLIASLTLSSTRMRADTGTCGGATITLPFTDVPAAGVFFCSIAEAFFSGLTNGTSPSTYNPGDPVTRDQMAAFITRTMDRSLQRGSRRAALDQYWTPTSFNTPVVQLTGSLESIRSDGADLWIADNGGNVLRVRASDGRLLETWTGATGAEAVVVAKSAIYITGISSPGKLYRINPSQPAGAVTTLSSALGDSPVGIAFDGSKIFTANFGGSVSIVSFPLTVTNVTTGFTHPYGILFDGTNIWVTDQGTNPGSLFKLDSNGAIIQTVPLGTNPATPVFDGTNIWVPNSGSHTITVVRASTGAVLATLTGNNLSGPQTVAFDGERILVTNPGADTLSLWKATDLSPLGSVKVESSSGPRGACSDGLNFWITLSGISQLARF